MPLYESVRRPDWLKELQAVLVVGLVIVGGLAVFGVGARAAVGGSLPLQLPASAVTGTVDIGLREGVAIEAVQEVTVSIADPTAPQRIVWSLTTLPTHLVVAALLVLLLQIVRRARHSDPFTRDTVRRLRILAVVALAGGYLGFLVELISSMYLSSTVTTEGYLGLAQLQLHWILIGFGLFAVAEVVNRGCAMRAELETVV